MGAMLDLAPPTTFHDDEMTNNNVAQPCRPVHRTSAKAACTVGALKAIFLSLRFVEKRQNFMLMSVN
jgi:purine-cytosine permease-like protein